MRGFRLFLQFLQVWGFVPLTFGPAKLRYDEPAPELKKS